jgi:hypothetical protein
MLINICNKLEDSRPRPATRGPRGRAALRPRLEGLETRFMPAIFSGIVNGQLRVTDTNAVDTVTLDHAGSTTLVNEAAFPDSAITNGILITVGTGVGDFDTVNIRATVKPVTVDGQFDIGTINVGKGGSVQQILASLTFKNVNGEDIGGTMNVDDSADTVARNVMLNVSSGLATISGLAPASISFVDDGVGFLNIRGGGGGNTFTVTSTPNGGGGSFHATQTRLFTGTGADTVNVLRTQDQSFLEIHGQNGRDKVTLGNAGSVQDIRESVRIDNSGSFTDLVVDDSADIIARHVTIDHTFDDQALNPLDPDFLYVRGLAPAEIVFNVHDMSTADIRFGGGGNDIEYLDFDRPLSNNLTTVLDTGTGNDTVRVRATRDSVLINGQNGHDTVSIGSDDLPGGSMTGILGSVRVTNVGSFTSLTLNDTVDTTGRIVTLDASPSLGQITGLSPGAITYHINDVDHLTVLGGPGGDTFFVRGTRGLAQPVVNGGLGDDTIVVGSVDLNLDTIQSAVTVNGGGGFDSLVLNDQGSHVPHTYTTTATQFRRSGGDTPTVIVNYSAIDSLQVNKGILPTNSPPLVKGLKFPGTIRAGTSATLTGHLADADGDKDLTLTVDWGDGSTPTAIKPGQKPFRLKHKSATAGTYTVRVIWTDGTGESNFRDLALVVTPRHVPSGPRRTAHHRP